MVLPDIKAIKKNKDKFQKFPGYLPALIRLEIDEWEYMEFLEKEGLLDDKLYNQLNKSRKSSYKEWIDEFPQWIKEHPEFEEFVFKN